MNTFTFHPKMLTRPVPFVVGTGPANPNPVKKSQFPINARYIRIIPNPRQLKKDLENDILMMPLTTAVINIKKFVHDFYSSIDWKFEEIDVTGIFQTIDKYFPKNQLSYTSEQIHDNLHLFPKLPLTETELYSIYIWYEKMHRKTTENIIYAIFETLDGRMIHLNGMFSYMESRNGTSCIDLDPANVYSPSLPMWYNYLPSDLNIHPDAFRSLINLYAISEWFNQHIS
jgi:hypothetical protein